MPPLSEIVASLYGAWRLAHLDPTGVAYFNDSIDGAWRSFFAAVLVAPPFALMLAFRYATLAAGTSLVRYILTEGIAYVVSWVAYPVLMASVTRLLGCGHRFTRYVIAYNWSLVLQHAVVLPIGILSAAGAIPAGATEFLWFSALALIFVYLWFIARTALELPALTAVGVVILDITLSLVINGVAEEMY